jgi:class 3 adenylate cyclase
VDIAAWLHSLGMQQYEEAFRDNAIDAAVLPELTADDLKDLGVSLVGHRRKLLAAIAALRADGTAVPETAAVAPSAERRQLTVMFCDLVGSTALSSRLDPEDLREVIGAYHRAVAEIVTRFDGFISRYMGDGVLIYFGFPQAHEDDAERAVRAGLSAIDAVAHLDVKSVNLQTRVGIATGLVVVGDLIGAGSAQEQSVVGETPNLAARLQALAEPDTVVIAASTRRLVGDLFDYSDLGAVEVKGIAGPVPAWQVLHPSAVESRFEALRGSALTPLVGRDEEIDLLLRHWARTKAGDGQVVLISGEAGLGKSRITAALAERLHAEPHLRLRYFCSPYHQDSALYPFIDQLGRAAQLVAVATEQGFAHWRAQGAIYGGWVKVKHGDVMQGMSLLHSGSSAYRATGAQAWMPHYTALLAGACEIAGRGEEALALLNDALHNLERTGERWLAAELNRHKGQLMLQQGHSPAAENLYRKALSIADEQEAKLWELRAAVSLARLRRDQGRPAEARDFLAPVYGWFTEGFDTPDLKVGKALLDELA